MRYLVVANKTLGGAALAAAVREIMAEGSCSFHIVVPASPPSNGAWTEGEAVAAAQDRLDREMAWFVRQGCEVTGEVGDHNPIYAITDALAAGEYDEIILSTLPLGISHWLRQDVLHRARRAFGLPVRHVVGEAAPVRMPA
jgi:GABA permease